MAESPQAEQCTNCEEPLALFEPVCHNCETPHQWEYEAPCHSCGETVHYTEPACPHCGATLSVWRALEADHLERDRPMLIWKTAVPRPTDAGYRVHLGSAQGQWMDYRRPLPDGGEFHVRSYTKRYELHHDDVSAIDAPGKHLLRHGAPAATASGLTLANRLTRAAVDSGRFAINLVRSPYTWIVGKKPPEDRSE